MTRSCCGHNALALKLGAQVEPREGSCIQECEETPNFLLTSQNAKA